VSSAIRGNHSTQILTISSVPVRISQRRQSNTLAKSAMGGARSRLLLPALVAELLLCAVLIRLDPEGDTASTAGAD
jgi:hypothetical protein